MGEARFIVNTLNNIDRESGEKEKPLVYTVPLFIFIKS
jgi:hypothetical protein